MKEDARRVADEHFAGVHEADAGAVKDVGRETETNAGDMMSVRTRRWKDDAEIL